jgi:putative heme-binding domain-containing protein
MVRRGLALAGVLLVAAALRGGDDTPHWIWTKGPASGEVRFQKAIPVAQPPQVAPLKLAADFCQAVVRINGRAALVVEPFCQAAECDVAALIRPGANSIEIVARPVGGPAAVALSLAAVAGNEQQPVVTDETWSAARSLGRVAPELWGVGRRSIDVDALENYEQWRQASGALSATDPATFLTAPGFEIALVRTAQPDEGSWVSMALDPQGRVTIAREDQGLLRLTLDRQGKQVEKVEPINTDLQECRGLLYAHGALYANANNSKGLYRLRDADGDGKFEDAQRLREFPGGVGHGRNDLALGPDGLIYSIHGDSVDVPAKEIFDRTSPHRDARRGQKTSEGYLVRTDQDGQRWEIVAGGLRNPFGVAFNAASDAFTYDADAEFDMGTPWYRPTRLVQLVCGADYAWRGVTGTWPPYFCDHAGRTPATLDIGKGSPTAVEFGAKSSFPPPYKDALFILDWTYGRVIAVHLAPRGAGNRAAAETFLQGRPLNVTDLAFGPDGAMYLVTGGRKTQSALYRIAYTGQPADPPAASLHERECAAHAAEVRKLRQSLEAFHGRLDPAAPAAAWPHLDSPDSLLRHAARLAVLHQPVDSWRARVLGDERPTATLGGTLMLLETGDAGPAGLLLDRLLSLRPAELDVSQQLMLLEAYRLLSDRAGDEVRARRERIIAQIDDLSSAGKEAPVHVSSLGTDREVRRQWCRLLVELQAPRATERTAAALLGSDVQEDRIMGLFLLRNVKQGWTPQTRRAFFTALAEAPKWLGGEGMPQLAKRLRDEAVATLSDDERHQLADVLAPPPPEPDLILPARPVVQQWKPEDFAAMLADANRRGDAQRGSAVFREAQCVRCHRVGARGPAVGPDLSHVAGRFSRRDMLLSVLTPSAVVAENYRNLQVQLADGRTLTGRVLVEGDYRSETLRLATNPLKPAEIAELNKREIVQSRLTETSPMPGGLLATFDEQAVLDLLAYLEAGESGQ